MSPEQRLANIIKLIDSAEEDLSGLRRRLNNISIPNVDNSTSLPANNISQNEEQEANQAGFLPKLNARNLGIGVIYAISLFAIVDLLRQDSTNKP